MKKTWMTIMEYSRQNGPSVSTIRRKIKSGKLTYKKEDGKYLIFAEEKKIPASNDFEAVELTLKLENDRLKQELRTLQQENEDLKMLVGLYEQQKTARPPEIPL